MEKQETPLLLSRLNEIVERSRLRRDKKANPGTLLTQADAGADLTDRKIPYPRRVKRVR